MMWFMVGLDTTTYVVCMPSLRTGKQYATHLCLTSSKGFNQHARSSFLVSLSVKTPEAEDHHWNLKMSLQKKLKT